MGNIWQDLIGLLASALEGLHDFTEPLFGDMAWGWAIILLTILVRIVLLPLTVKQARNMRAMQALRPELKRIQDKYKPAKGQVRGDPEKVRDMRAKQTEELSALYKAHNVNPAAGCLPLVAQMPILLALYQVLANSKYVPGLQGAPFYFIGSLSENATAAGIGAILLIVLFAATTFLSQRQTMQNSPSMGQQQQILLYVMPVVLTFVSFNLPAGVLLYWVVQNLWTLGQQGIMFRKPAPEVATGGKGGKTGEQAPTGKAAKRKGKGEGTEQIDAVASTPTQNGNNQNGTKKKNGGKPQQRGKGGGGQQGARSKKSNNGSSKGSRSGDQSKRPKNRP